MSLFIVVTVATITMGSDAHVSNVMGYLAYAQIMIILFLSITPTANPAKSYSPS